eukprot:60554_1
MAALAAKASYFSRSLYCVGGNGNGEFGIGNKKPRTQLTKCDWSQKIQTINIYTANLYTIVKDTDGNYYSAGYNSKGACSVKDNSSYILNMTPITYFNENNIKISQVFVNNRGEAPFWKAYDGSIYTSCNRNYYGRLGFDVDRNKIINKIPFLSQLSIKKMVSGHGCSIAI